MILAEDIQLQEITLDEFLTEYLPDYKIEKQIQLEGIGRDFAVAKDSGEIVAVTGTDEEYIVKMLDLEGNYKWSHSFDNNYYNISALVSDNGNTTTLFLNEGEGRGKNIIISKEGKILYESPIIKSKFYPSPDGNYVYENQNVMGGRQKELKIYDRYGERIIITGLENYQIREIRIKFADNSHIIVFIKQENIEDIQMCFCEFNEGNIEVLWQHELEKGYGGIEPSYLSTRDIEVFDNKIALDAGLSGFFVFDFEGNVICEYDQYCVSFCFSNDGNIISNMILSKENFIKIIDIGSGEETEYPLNLNIFDITRFLRSITFNNKYLVSIARAFYSKKKHHSLIFDKDNRTFSSVNENFYFLSVNNSDVIIAINYIPNSIITVLYGGEK